MLQFLQANATVIFFGIALLFMLYMHSGRGHGMGAGGGGCGMGHQHGESQHPGSSHEHGTDHAAEARPVEAPLETGKKEAAIPVAIGSDHTRQGGGCH